MIQRARKLEPEERLIQYAIELFDLVDIVPPTRTGRFTRAVRSIVYRYPHQPDTLSATRYANAQNTPSHVGSNP